jgi:hypothetical protein
MKRQTRIILPIVAALLATPVTARADVVLDWNAIMLTTVSSQNPFAQARFAAITQLAVFEAVNACTGRYTPYLRTVSAQAGCSAEAAAVAAAHGALKHYFPAQGASLDTARAQSLANLPEGRRKSYGIAVGEAIAAAMIAARATDGATPPETHLPESADPGVWQPTPPAFGPGILLHWRNLTPFGIESSDQFRSDPSTKWHTSAPPRARTARRIAPMSHATSPWSAPWTPGIKPCNRSARLGDGRCHRTQERSRS